MLYKLRYTFFQMDDCTRLCRWGTMTNTRYLWRYLFRVIDLLTIALLCLLMRKHITRLTAIMLKRTYSWIFIITHVFIYTLRYVKSYYVNTTGMTSSKSSMYQTNAIWCHILVNIGQPNGFVACSGPSRLSFAMGDELMHSTGNWIYTCNYLS